MNGTTIETRPDLQPPLSFLAVHPRWTPFDRSSRRVRPAHWPAPDANRDLAAALIVRHDDLTGLSPDDLRSELNLAQLISWRYPLRPPGRRWLNERIGRIRTELRSLPVDGCAWQCGR